MMNTKLQEKLQTLNNNQHALTLLWSLGLLLCLQLMNMLIFKCLDLPNTAYPWSFFSVLAFGFITPVLLCLLVTGFPLIAFWYWLRGGLERAVASYVLIGWIGFILLTSLALYGFSLWENITITPYPWLAYLFLTTLQVGSEPYNHLILCLLLSYTLLFIPLLYKGFSSKTKAEKIFGHAHFANAFEMHQSGLFSETGLILGKAHGRRLKLPGFEGMLVVAPTGSGKTTAIAIPNLLEWQGSGVFNDLKGELYNLTAKYRQNRLGNTVHCWAPANPNKKTACYNPFYYVDKNPDLRIRDLQLIAETLIPATKLGDGFWYQSSREVFLTLSLYLFETTGEATLGDIHDLSKQQNFFVWLLGEIRGNEKIFSKHLKQNAYAILGADGKTQKNILKDFHSRMQLFNDPLVNHATHKNDFDFGQLRKNKMSIYIQIPDSDKERLSPILTLFWAQLINALSAKAPQQDEPYGVLGLMDEFGNMARINKLKDGLSFLRSYHFRPVIIVQYLGQIISTYGRDDAKGFLNTKVKMAFALNDMDDAKFFSSALGTKTVKVSSTSVSTGHGDNPGSRSTNINHQSRALMHPDEIMQLPKDKAIILLEAKNPIKVNKCYWYKEYDYRALIAQTNFEEHHES